MSAAPVAKDRLRSVLIIRTSALEGARRGLAEALAALIYLSAERRASLELRPEAGRPAGGRRPGGRAQPEITALWHGGHW